MRYVESVELREWIKENLRKTIFQKAHALAIQTGCEVLVKVHDVTDIENCQVYSTRSLKRIYQSSKLRQPGETHVSGETGLPLRDKCIQSCIEDEAEAPSERLMESGFEQTEEMEMNAITTQTPGENEYESSTVVDSNSEIQVKSEPDDIEQQEQVEAPDPELMVNEQKSSEADSLASPGVESRTPTISRLQPLMFSSVQKRAVPISPKPYQCSICQKTFRSVQILQKHTLTFHSKPKPRSPMSFSRGKGRGRGKGYGAQYFRHQESQEHLEPRGYHCVMCNQSFHTQDILQDHVTQMHSMAAALIATDQNSTSQQQQQSSDQHEDPNQPLSDPSHLLEDGSVPGTSSSDLPEGKPAVGPLLMDTSLTFDMSQGSESAFNMSTASTSSSHMEQPSPGRRGLRVKLGDRPWKWRSHRKVVKTSTMNQFIMEAILLTPGPVSTRTAVNTAGPRFLRGSISNHQFQHACYALQNANLGHLISTSKSTGTSGTQVFIKKKPQEVVEHLLKQRLCTVEEYSNRYSAKAPKCISQKLCTDLVVEGHVTGDQFQGRGLSVYIEAPQSSF